MLTRDQKQRRRFQPELVASHVSCYCGASAGYNADLCFLRNRLIYLPPLSALPWWERLPYGPGLVPFAKPVLTLELALPSTDCQEGVAIYS